MCCVTELEVDFKESACRPQETGLVMAVWKGGGGDGPGKTINREGLS